MVDGAVRDLSEWRFPSLTRRWSAFQVSRGLIGPLGMISFGSSGYTREAAVLLLAGDQSGTELPFLIIRLKDWVREVRGAAERAVVERIRPNYAEHFVRCLPLISILRGRKRSDHGGIFEAIEELLRGEDVRPLLRKAMLEGDRETRRAAFELLMSRSNRDSVEVLREALESRGCGDSVVGGRMSCACGWKGRSWFEVLGQLVRDRFLPVLRVALVAYAERLPELAREQLRAALMDRHMSMRVVGRFYFVENRPSQISASFMFCI